MPRCALIVDLRLPSEAWGDLTALLTEHARLTRAEETGCLGFEVLHPSLPEGGVDQARIMMVEIYADRAALDVHRANPRMPGVLAATSARISGIENTLSDIVTPPTAAAAGVAHSVLVVDLHPKPGTWGELTAILLDHARLTLAEEPGCRRFEVLHPEAGSGYVDRDRIVLVEMYDDREALAAHRRNPRMPAVGNAINALCQSRGVANCDLAT